MEVKETQDPYTCTVQYSTVQYSTVQLSEAFIQNFVLYASVATFSPSKCYQQLRVNFMFCYVCLHAVCLFI
jgi:hypothetical protein